MNGIESLVLLLVFVYLLPTIVAFGRNVPNKGTVAVLNIFLGWSFVGWVVSLAHACASR
jgi:hypothetical protein